MVLNTSVVCVAMLFVVMNCVCIVIQLIFMSQIKSEPTMADMRAYPGIECSVTRNTH